MEVLAKYLPPEDVEPLRAGHGDAAVPTWGVTPGGRDVNRRKWERISPGDVVLMVRDGEVFVTGRVTHTARHEALAERLWGRDEAGSTWEYLYFLDDLRPQSISVAELNVAAGYAPNNRVQGFNVLAEETSDTVIAALGLHQLGAHIKEWQVTEWLLRPGDRIQRTELHEQYGGRGQGGIGPSRKSPNVLLFTDPETGQRHGYFDEWTTDGIYNYYGEGQRGDQRMVSGNAAVLSHQREGRALRLFQGSRGIVEYIGQFELDGERQWFEADAPETGGGPTRKAIVFRLRPVDIPPQPGSAVTATLRDPVVDLVPVEEQYTEHAYVDPSREPYEAERREAVLVRTLRDHLLSLGHTVGRFRIVPPGESKPLFNDLFDETANVLIEGKGSVSREAVRMAIGQLADYVRFCAGASRAILVPERPRADLVDLCRTQDITLIWPTKHGYEAEPAIPW
jgi:hypothetical protein